MGGGIQVGMASATSEALWPQAPAEGSGQSSRSLGEVFRQTLRLPSRSGVAAALNASPSPLALGTISSPENLSAPSSHQALQVSPAESGGRWRRPDSGTQHPQSSMSCLGGFQGKSSRPGGLLRRELCALAVG